MTKTYELIRLKNQSSAKLKVKWWAKVALQLK